MKNIIWTAVIIVSLTACNKKSENVSTTITEKDTINHAVQIEKEQLYSCPMHPEVIGKKGEKCPKCEMDLTVEVAK